MFFDGMKCILYIQINLTRGDYLSGLYCIKYVNPKRIVFHPSERHRVRGLAGRGGEEHFQLLCSVPLLARHRHPRHRRPHPLLYITQVRLITVFTGLGALSSHGSGVGLTLI